MTLVSVDLVVSVRDRCNDTCVSEVNKIVPHVLHICSEPVSVLYVSDTLTQTHNMFNFDSIIIIRHETTRVV